MVGQGAKCCGNLGLVRCSELGSKGQALLTSLPEDLQWVIWQKYFREHTLSELIRSYRHTWESPSDSLLDICSDVGCIQHGHSELEDLIEDENMWAWKGCIESKCQNCVHWGFPCLNLAEYGFQIPELGGQWTANF
jgi:hypothetical protein